MPTLVATLLKPASGLIVASLLIAQGFSQSAPQPGMHRAEKHESKHEIDQLEEQWRDAALKNNTASMDALLADDYVGVTASGTLQNKDQALANLRDGSTHFTSLELADRKVRFYGTTAVVNSIARVEGITPDGKLSGSFRYTRVYVRNPRGVWRVVSFEASRIREPGEHK
jgi:ketosteroid isomerase-like protein